MRTFIKITLAVMAIAACSPREAPPMAGDCVDRTVPNVFGGPDEVVSFKQCRWQGATWVCRVSRDAMEWTCRPVTRPVP